MSRKTRFCFLLFLFAGLAGGGTLAARNNKEDTAGINQANRRTLETILKGNYPEALALAEKAKGSAEKAGYSAGLAQAYNHLGMIYRNKGNNEKALENYLLSLKLFETEGDIKRVAGLYNNIARIYDNIGDYPSALGYFFKSLRSKEKTGDKTGIANTLGHIGDIYHSLGNEKDLEYYSKSLQIQEEIQNLPGIAIALNQLGKAYEAMGNYSKAQEYFFRSLEVNKRAQYAPEIAASLNHLGTIWRLQGSYDEALDYYTRALALTRTLHNKEEESTIQVNLGLLYFSQKKYETALGFFLKGKEAADSSGVLKKIKDAHDHLSQVYEALQQPAKAFYYYKFYIAARDSIYNHKKRMAALSTQLKYEYEKKAIEATLRITEEKKLAEARLKQERTLHYALTVSLLAVLLAGFLIFQRFRHRQKLNEYRLRAKIASDLHDDIGSALSSISMYSGVMRMNLPPGKDAEIVKKIEETSRETIESIGDIVWSVQTSNNTLHQVTERMQVFANNLLAALGMELKFTSGEGLIQVNLGMEQRRNLYLIFKEAVNNAAKYSKAGKITVEVSSQAGWIQLKIADNGMGFALEQTEAGNGFYTMQQRAKELKGRLEINSTPGKGTEIRLQFKPT